MNTRQIIFNKLMDNSKYIYAPKDGIDGHIFQMSLTELSKEIADELYRQQEEQELQIRSVQDESSMANEPEGEQE